MFSRASLSACSSCIWSTVSIRSASSSSSRMMLPNGISRCALPSSTSTSSRTTARNKALHYYYCPYSSRPTLQYANNSRRTHTTTMTTTMTTMMRFCSSSTSRIIMHNNNVAATVRSNNTTMTMTMRNKNNNHTTFLLRRRFFTTTKTGNNKQKSSTTKQVGGSNNSSKAEEIKATTSSSFWERFFAPKPMPERRTWAWYREMVLICTVFGITGSSTMFLVRPAVSKGLGIEGTFRDGPWSYRICSIVIMTPVYASLLIVVGTIFGRHAYFRHFAVKIFSRFGIPPEAIDRNFHVTKKTFRKW